MSYSRVKAGPKASSQITTQRREALKSNSEHQLIITQSIAIMVLA
jgi:hypothetical protein